MKVKHKKKDVPPLKACVKDGESNDGVGIYDILSEKPDRDANYDSLSGDKALDDSFRKAFGTKK